MNRQIAQHFATAFLGLTLMQCSMEKPAPIVYETAANGNKLTLVSEFSTPATKATIEVLSEEKRQVITGFGGAFTEASASLLNRMSPEKRGEIIAAYFGDEGAKYSLARTHMNSCDFSLSQYSYAPIPGDTALEHFTIDPDREDLIPMIKAAQALSSEGFKLFASPWTASPWMKDNGEWVGGKLLKEHYPTWALFFSKYVDAYAAEGIPIWGFTVENEPLGNGNNWESMIYSPEEMVDFVQNHLGPRLEADGKGDLIIMGYDQNREELPEWVDAMYQDEATSRYFDGTAIHWYESTYDYFPKELEYAHAKAPNKLLIQTEACVDAQVPVWKDDAWYWSKNATDWGYTWREESKKYLHPKYAPSHRYARDIMGCLNHWVDGWVDWNMVLDRQGGPNWKENWCVAPIIVDPENDEVYYTPMYYILSQFSKFLRPGAQVYQTQCSDESLLVVAAKNVDGTQVVYVFNETEEEKGFELSWNDHVHTLSIPAQALQTIILTNE